MLRTRSSGVTFKPNYNLAFLLGTFEVIHIFVCNEKENCNNYAVSTTCHHTKLRNPGGQVPGILFSPALNPDPILQINL